MDRIPFEKQDVVISWKQALYILWVGELVLRNHILHGYITSIEDYVPFNRGIEYSFTASNIFAYINIDPGRFLKHMNTTIKAKNLLFEQIGIKQVSEGENELAPIDQIYNPETATHSAKVKEAVRLETENLKLPPSQRMKRAEMGKKIFGDEARGDRERQVRNLLEEAREKGLLPPE
jgi:hypothetical protein